MEGLLPIIKEKKNSRPITASLDPNSVDEFLRQQARLERLAESAINPPNAKTLHLEPIPHELFEIFNDGNEDTPMMDTTDMEIGLYPVGQLNILDDSDIDENTSAATEAPLINLDLTAYRKRREETNERLKQLMDMSRQEEVRASPVAEEGSTAVATTMQTPHPETLKTAPQQQASVIEETSNVPAAITTSKAGEPPTFDMSTAWFDNPQIDMTATTTTTTGSFNTPVYAYPDSMVPVFATAAQQSESDAISRSPSAQASMLFNMHLDKVISALNNPSVMVDTSSPEKWQLSGKYMFIQELLAHLGQQELTICIVTKDMEDEARLLDLVRDHLKLDCLRINIALDAWDGEYGLFIRTHKQQERIGAYADLVICLDVRVNEDNFVFSKIKNRNDQKPPVLWLVTMGSTESKAFYYLKDHGMLLTASKSNTEFKNLVLQPSEWPPSNECQKMTAVVASNVASWFLSKTKQNANYQFRSTTCLPQSYQLGTLLDLDNNNTQEIVDMDTSSDTDLIDVASMNAYIEKANSE